MTMALIGIYVLKYGVRVRFASFWPKRLEKGKRNSLTFWYTRVHASPIVDPSTPHSQPLPVKESSQSENGGRSPSLKRSATSPYVTLFFDLYYLVTRTIWVSQVYLSVV